jgi:hypothetical protein
MTTVSDYQRQVGEDLAAFELSMEKFRALVADEQKWKREIAESKAAEAAILKERDSGVDDASERFYRQNARTRILESRALDLETTGAETYQLATQLCVTFSGLACAFTIEAKDKATVLGIDPAQLVDPSNGMPFTPPLTGFPPHEQADRRKRILETVARDLPQRIQRVAAMMSHLSAAEPAKQPAKAKA